MDMRARKRAVLARTVAPWMPPPEEVEMVAALTQVRRARVAMLRRPALLKQVRTTIRAMPKGPARALRKMLDEDLKLMRLMDRQERRRA